jgi:hypothetical protein
MADIIVLLVIVAIVSGAVWKIRSDKKKGIKCSGCPHSKVCPSQTACHTYAKKPS